MFLKATPAYFAAHPRLIFVGQETHGWWTNGPHDTAAVTVPAVMDFYQSSGMNEYRVRANSPFWRAIRKLASSFGVAGFPEAILTGNLFPCDSDKAQAPEILLETMRRWRILPEELRILDPEVVIFFAGPVYSYNLGCYFGDKVEPALSSKNPWISYRPQGEKWRGWVTYHPASLQRSKHGTVLDEIIQDVQRGL
jgi:hypothetical protein